MSKTPNHKKINKIRETLRKNPEGLWIRELARITKLDKSLVSRYINTHLKNEIKDLYKTKKPIRIIKLK